MCLNYFKLNNRVHRNLLYFDVFRCMHRIHRRLQIPLHIPIPLKVNRLVNNVINLCRVSED